MSSSSPAPRPELLVGSLYEPKPNGAHKTTAAPDVNGALARALLAAQAAISAGVGVEIESKRHSLRVVVQPRS
jgi:hypothetical protein